LVLQFFQMKIFFNLKSDYEFEMFQEKCQRFLIKESNKFKSNFNKCFTIFQSIQIEPFVTNESLEKSRFVCVLSDFGVYFFWSYLAFVVFLAVYFLIENQNDRQTIAKFPYMIHYVKCLNETKIIYHKASMSEIHVNIESD
jgi:hypothetical protein